MPIPYSNALDIIQQYIIPITRTQNTPLLESIHQISSGAISARWDMPNDAISLKEGYGIHLVDAHSTYHLHAEQSPVFVSENCAITILTGSTLTPGVNAVVAKEDVLMAVDGTFKIPSSTFIGQNIKQRGEDFMHNECILKRLESINPYTLASISSQGITHIETFCPPKISILSVGDALIPLGLPKQTSKVYNSNAICLAARLKNLGATIHKIEVCQEDPTLIIKKLTLLSEEADFIITTGGMGTHDAMYKTLNHHDLSVLFHYIQISPARPSALSLLFNTPILHLPGLPLACLLGFEMLGTAILKVLQHRPLNHKSPTHLKNKHIITCKANSTSAIPGLCDGNTFTHAHSYQAGMLAILSSCNGYILTEGKESIQEGEDVIFFSF